MEGERDKQESIWICPVLTLSELPIYLEMAHRKHFPYVSPGEFIPILSVYQMVLNNGSTDITCIQSCLSPSKTLDISYCAVFPPFPPPLQSHKMAAASATVPKLGDQRKGTVVNQKRNQRTLYSKYLLNVLLIALEQQIEHAAGH